MTTIERIQLLTSVHCILVDAAKLPEATRPHAIHSRLETIQKEIMEELAKHKNEPTTSPFKTYDDVPF